MDIKLQINDKSNATALGGCSVGDVVTLDFEDEYLPGAVAAEIGGEIGADTAKLAAAKAQAIAMRTNALRYIRKDAAATDQSSTFQAFDAARMTNAAYALCRRAVEETEGIVLCYDGDLIDAPSFSASNGGRTTSALERWPSGGGRPWLIAQDDPWDAATGEPKTGHGVGMSQLGAIYASATPEKTYQEILAFYYPGTELREGYGEETVTEAENMAVEMEETDDMDVDFPAQKVIAFERDQVGEPYDIRDHGPDRWDCSGLTMEAVKEIGLVWKHSSHYQYYDGISASGDFGAHGKIATMPKNRLVFLFNYGERSNNKGMGMVHVGTYDPIKRTVIQAGGYGGSGVHEDAIDGDGFKPLSHFTDWATLKSSVGGEEITTQADPDTDIPATIRYGSKGDDVRKLQELLSAAGYSLGDSGVDGKFGSKTRSAVKAYQAAHGLNEDGIVGPRTWDILLSVKASNAEETESDSEQEADTISLFTATVPNLTAEQADTLVKQYSGTTVVQQG